MQSESESGKDQSVVGEESGTEKKMAVSVRGSGSTVNIYSTSAKGPDTEERMDVSAQGEGSTINVHSGQTAEVAPSEKPGASYYEDFISKVLDNTLARKGAIEQRGISVVTTAGTLVTIVFAVVSFVLAHVASNTINPHSIIRGAIDGAAILFVIAAGLGLLVNLPVPYGEPHPLELANILFPEETESDQPAGGADQREDESRLEASSQSSPQQTAIDPLGPPDSPLVVIPAGNDLLQGSQEISRKARFFTDTAGDAAWKIAATRVKLLRQARRWNFLKAQLLFLAILSEVGAIGLLAWG
jgi:hypothetical protein